MWLESLQVADLRRIQHAHVELGPGLNVFTGSNAQGKTSILEAVAVLARGRSFRTDQVQSLIRRGAGALRASGVAISDTRRTALDVEVSGATRRLLVDGCEVTARGYQGRLEAVVYATERLRIVRGTMRDRRQFVDRAAAAQSVSYRQVLRDYERVLLQRNAALERGGADVGTWTERFLQLGTDLRVRRASYVARLSAALEKAFNPAGEVYDILLVPGEVSAPLVRDQLERELRERSRDELRARRSLVGPHRDLVVLRVGAEAAAEGASSGQVRSLLLALVLTMLEVYREQTGEAPVALLDDLDSELDDARADELCQEVCRRGQALVTTAHPEWAQRLGRRGRLFRVQEGMVSAA